MGAFPPTPEPVAGLVRPRGPRSRPPVAVALGHYGPGQRAAVPLIYSPRMGARAAAGTIGRLLGLLAIVVGVTWTSLDSRAAQGPLVAAAANLRQALPEIAAAFASTGGATPPRLTFGSSGNLVRQIHQGAPYEMFLSADEGFALALAREGRARDDGVVYAVGRLVMLVPANSPLQADGSLADLEAAVEDGRLQRLAIANPEHAPYGRAARQVLIRRGLWDDRIQRRLVIGENVAQAVQFALSGGAEGGIVAYALALAPPVAAVSSYGLIPAQWHEPLRQRMVLLEGASMAAAAFYDYLQSPDARAIFARNGFTPPPDAAR